MMHDIRYALRTIRKHPGYAAVVVGTLALALGATTTLFSVADATLLAPLPVAGGDRVVNLHDVQPNFGGPASASWPEVQDWRQQARSLEGVTVERTESMSWRGASEPERLIGAYVSEDFFAVFGVAPMVGRDFTTEEHRKGGPPVVILGNGFWKRAFAADPKVIGRTLALAGRPFTVVGVLPPAGPDLVRGPRDVWIPIEPRLPSEARGEHYLTVFARLAPGATLASAKAELDALGPRLDTQNSGHRIGVRSLREQLYGKARGGIFVLMVGALLVLLIAGANVTSIMLARMNARTHELGVRAALGASRARLGRQLLTESLILSLAGGAVGVLLALWGKDMLLSLWPAGANRPEVVPLAWRTLVFTGLAATVVGALVGMAPALRGSRTDLAGALRGGVVPRSGRLRAALVVLQHAFAIILLVAAGLLGQSLMRLLSVKPGFDPMGVITVNVSVPEAKYPDFQRRRAFYEAVADRLRGLPGVEAASAISNIPFGGSNTSGSFEIEGRPEFPSNAQPQTAKMVVDGDYFRTMRIPILEGRSFSQADKRLLIVINKTFADRYFPGESPLGRRIDAWGGFAEVVGVVGDIRRLALEDEPEPQIYMNLEQAMPWVTFVVRTGGDPTKLFGGVKAQVYAVDPQQPVSGVGTLDDLVVRSAAQRRVLASMVSGFAAVALLLAALGIYGVLSYSVSQRTREIGVRMALGARAGSVLALVLGQGLRLALAGTALGLGVALLVTHAMAAFLYGVSATDPTTYAVVACVLLAVGTLACLLPARRAARVDPMTALRYE